MIRLTCIPRPSFGKQYGIHPIILLLLAGWPSPGHPQTPAWPETLMLDTRGPEVTTSRPLTLGSSYRISISGTYSAWTAGTWATSCGTPEPMPLTPSPGVTNGPVGLDPEIWFAAAFCGQGDTLCCCNVPCPRHHPFFRMNLGAGWSHLEPIGGPPVSVSPGHSYEYEVSGQGMPASFLNYDDVYGDNYGVLTIVVEPAPPSGVGEPRLVSLSLDPIRPSLTGVIEVSFSLPSSDQARIELLTVAGRRVEARFVEHEGARQRMRLGSPDLSSGIYFVRLSQRHEVVVRRACVLH